MNEDLISRQAAIDTYLETVSSLCVDEGDGILTACARDRDILEMLENLPSVQPKTGRWECLDSDKNTYKCTACGAVWVIEEGTPKENEMFFCCRCGAGMEETE